MALKKMDPIGVKVAKAMGVVGDRISGLPDELIHRIICFLPARDAVRTSVLSLRWRYMWTSARCLNIDAEGFDHRCQFVKLATALLLRRGCTPLDSFWLRAKGPSIFLYDFDDIANDWICHALRSNVQVLGIFEENLQEEEEEEDLEEEVDTTFQLNHYPFTSSYLRKLHLCFVSISNQFTEHLFSGCPALEDLEMINCNIYASEFSSAMLKNLTIDYVGFPPHQRHGNKHDIMIYMPSLVSLRIGALLCKTPSLLGMRSLITASLSLDHPSVTFADACGILGALSSVKNLDLLFPNDVVAGESSLQSDMLLCGVVFTNLTTLSLSDWCLRGKCKALLYLLEHSPNLEELTLKMRKLGFYDHLDWFPSAAVETDSPCKETETPFDCEKLKKIEIICPKHDKRVSMLVAILFAKITSSPEISIKPFSGSSWC